MGILKGLVSGSPRALLGVFLALIGVSCAELQSDYRVLAINTDQQEIPCVVMKDGQPLLNDSNEPVKTPAGIHLKFKEKEDGTGYEAVQVGVRALIIDSKGAARVPRDGEPAPYLEDLQRYVYPADSRVQLFVLTRNKDYSEAP